MSDVITEGRHTGEFIASEANGYRSRGVGTLLSGQNLAAGSVLGQITIGAKTAAGAAGLPAPAAATITASPTASAAAETGAHRFECIVGGAGAASKWRHTDPSGDFVGIATGNAAYAGGGLSALTITDAGTDPTAGEAFVVTVAEAAASKKWKLFDPGNTDGSGVAAAILYDNVDASAGDQRATLVARDAEVNAHCLEWFEGATDNEKAAAAVQLAAVGIVVRA